MKPFVAACVLALLVSAAGAAIPDVNVVVDMTKDGRESRHPTSDHPLYYLPVMRGAREIGEPVAGEAPISAHDVVRVVAPELAGQGYRVVNDQHSEADLIIDISWGYITPTEDPNVKNYNQREALVLGRTVLDVAPLESFGHDEFMESVRESRYFVVITAYDYRAWSEKHLNQMLWKAKMSIPTSGVFFNDVLVPLVKAGAPSFGRETLNHPKLLPAIPDGHIELGTPTLQTDRTLPVPASPK